LAAAGLGLVAAGLEGAEAIDRAVAEERLEQAIEEAARCEHEGWVRTKIETGWSYDAVRNNEDKKHPSIIDYDELSDEEKDKDRSAVRNYIDIAVQAGLGFVGLGVKP
jgi:hypothetical protein